jgi:bifunctional NMN adenylyltransferase/nudix hydrolase
MDNQFDHDTMVFIGRFQPLHYSHLEVILQGLGLAKKLVVLIGSARTPRSYRNPFTYNERVHMITESVKDVDPALLDRLHIEPLVDLPYNDEQWIKNTQHTVYEYVEQGETVTLIGHAKDRSSYYLDMFPTWKSISVQNFGNLDSTAIRRPYFSNIGEMWLKDCDGHKIGDLPKEKIVPSAVKRFLDEFIKTSDYQYVYDEFAYVANYQKPYANLPFPPVFVTVDACVVQSGHVLLVKRKCHPGKGLWALPGGFLDANETIADATIRELYEETALGLHERIIRGSATQTRTFDDPHRSSRGRTITHCTLFHLERRRSLPVVKGQESEVERVKWWPLAQIQPEMMFEDHFGIITAHIGDK